jgi:hypothetical protein
MVTTSSNLYWAPLKPRITIYSLNDDTYSTALYSYNAFTDTGSSNNKPIGLSFETNTTNVGQCSLTIEDADQDFNENDWLKGNRIFIEGSKDGTTWQPAFKGLGRGIVQEAYGPTGRNLTFNGYNYLIRLNERIIKVNKESTKTGSIYNETDTNMFTDNLLFNILDVDSNYIYSQDDFSLIDVLKHGLIQTSPITQWIPKLDIEFGTLASAIDEILDYSGGLLTVNFADDQLVLYDPEQVTSSTGVFMVTNTVNKLADEVNATMYPLEPYNYNIYYDTDESSNRLILPFKHPDSAPATSHKEFTADQINATANNLYADLWTTGNAKQWWAVNFSVSPAGDPGLIRAVLQTFGNCSSFASNSLRCWIYNDTAPPAASKPTIPISGPMVLYPMKSDGTFPTGGVGYPSTPTAHFPVGMRDGDFCGEMLSNQLYWLVFESTAPQTTTNFLVINAEVKGPATLPTHSTSPNGTTWSAQFSAVPLRIWNVPFKDQGKPEINLDWMVMANDRNGQARLGPVERPVSSIPDHIDGLQTIQEYLYPRLYLASKPRFSFDYPRLTMPNRIPKAGDVLVHYDTTVNVGTRTTPIQSSIITSARFEFGQDSDGVLGLRKLGLSTAGIRKGYY